MAEHGEPAGAAGPSSGGPSRSWSSAKRLVSRSRSDGSLGGDVREVAGHARAGAELGGRIGGGQGAAIGAVVGAGAGAVKSPEARRRAVIIALVAVLVPAYLLVNLGVTASQVGGAVATDSSMREQLSRDAVEAEGLTAEEVSDYTLAAESSGTTWTVLAAIDRAAGGWSGAGDPPYGIQLDGLQQGSREARRRSAHQGNGSRSATGWLRARPAVRGDDAGRSRHRSAAGRRGGGPGAGSDRSRQVRHRHQSGRSGQRRCPRSDSEGLRAGFVAPADHDGRRSDSGFRRGLSVGDRAEAGAAGGAGVLHGGADRADRVAGESAAGGQLHRCPGTQRGGHHRGRQGVEAAGAGLADRADDGVGRVDARRGRIDHVAGRES